jgi:type VI secretion system protein ImpE
MAETNTLLEAGQLEDAVASVSARLRTHPTDHAARTTLAELLCLSGAFDRAEAQLAVVASQTVDRPVAIARMRHLIRAAVAREAWFAQGAVPALMGEPTPLQRIAIALDMAMRAGEAERTAELLEQAEAARPHLSGLADGTAFDDWRDVDDRSAWFLDVLTHDGGYLWVDPATVAGLRFSPAARPIDLLWRETRMALHDGRVADVVVPAQYAAAPLSGQAHRLGQVTEWHDLPGGACTGAGQRLWLLGEDARGVLELSEISFAAPA